MSRARGAVGSVVMSLCALISIEASLVERAAAQSCLGGAVALPPPGGPDVFLRFLESFAVEDQTTADAYYRAVDPYDRRETLEDWLVVNRFLQPGETFGPGVPGGDPGDSNVDTDAMAVYVNAADLGFGRRMYLRRNASGALASYVENYGDDLKRIDGSEQDILDNAKTRDPAGLIATVCMEYVAPDDEPTGRKRVTFYTYNGAGQRTGIQGLNLDGRGDKGQPGVCNVCHGGAPRALVNGVYPGKGDTNAYFLPWDVATFKFDAEPGFTRADQEPQFKNFNQAVAAHHSQTARLDRISGITRQVAPLELIQGWYGGVGLPSPTFDESFVPMGWRPSVALGIPPGADAVYREVIGPNCRACHVQRERSLDFATFKGFRVFRDATMDLVFQVPFSIASGGNDDSAARPGDDKAVMPLALRTYLNFWNSDAPEKLCTFLSTMP